MPLSAETVEKIEERLRKSVGEHALNAAAWYFDGNTDEATYQRVLDGIEAGDPAILGTLPEVDWSMQWADGLDWNEEFAYAYYRETEQEYDDLNQTEQIEHEMLSDSLFVDVGQDYADACIVDEIERVARFYVERKTA